MPLGAFLNLCSPAGGAGLQRQYPITINNSLLLSQLLSPRVCVGKRQLKKNISEGQKWAVSLKKKFSRVRNAPLFTLSVQPKHTDGNKLIIDFITSVLFFKHLIMIVIVSWVGSDLDIWTKSGRGPNYIGSGRVHLYCCRSPI